MTTNKPHVCKSCGVDLVPIENWYKSFVDKHHYKCTTCYDKTRLINRIKKDGPKPGWIAQLVNLTGHVQFNKLRSGHIYIISNPAWPNWFKVGSSYNAVNRRNSYQTSSPYRDYKLIKKFFSERRRSAEAYIHKALEASGFARQGEWFKADSSKQIEKIINENIGHFNTRPSS